MASRRYEPKMREKIIGVAREARANKQSWLDALALAKQEGFRSGLPGLIRMVQTDAKKTGKPIPGKRRRRGRKGKLKGMGRPAKIVRSYKKRGRRKGKGGRPKGGGGVSDVQRAINGLVRERVAGVFASLRAALNQAEKSL